MKRIHPAGKADACLENSNPTLDDSGFFGTPGAHSVGTSGAPSVRTPGAHSVRTPGAHYEWNWSADRRMSSCKEMEVQLWQTPASYIRNKWRGRASFVEEESSPWMRKLGPQHILKGLVVLVILASLGFAGLTYSRHVRGSLNGKYKSIEFGRVKRSVQLEEEGNFILEGIVDEGNEMGGKIKVEMESLLELEAQLKEIEALLEGNLDSELEIKREAQTEGFRYAAQREGSEVLLNLRRLNRDVNDGHGFRFVPDDDSKQINKRNTKDEGFRYVADSSAKEDTFRLATDNEDAFRFSSDQ